MLRTHHGERVYDAEDVFVLARLDEITVMLDLHCIQQAVMTAAIPSTAQQRHMLERGHRLAFGCCRLSKPMRADRNVSVDSRARSREAAHEREI